MFTDREILEEITESIRVHVTKFCSKWTSPRSYSDVVWENRLLILESHRQYWHSWYPIRRKQILSRHLARRRADPEYREKNRRHQRAWRSRQVNRDKKRQSDIKYYAKNKSIIYTKSKAWWTELKERDPELFKAKKRQYNQAWRDKKNAKQS